LFKNIYSIEAHDFVQTSGHNGELYKLIKSFWKYIKISNQELVKDTDSPHIDDREDNRLSMIFDNLQKIDHFLQNETNKQKDLHQTTKLSTGSY
jgi:hypothetical protein